LCGQHTKVRNLTSYNSIVECYNAYYSLYCFPSVLVLYYNLVSSEFVDMEDIGNEVVMEDKREITSGLQQLELDDAQEKIK
jgi:hypothetical protein